MKKNVFSADDFTEKKMKPYFMNEKIVLNLLQKKEFEIIGAICKDVFEPKSFFAFKDNNSKTLAVAHMDTINIPSGLKIEDGIIKSSVVDNRLGVYIITELLQRKNINSDLLITTNEEICYSSARYFIPEKTYNWIYSFDRFGDNAALYQYINSTSWVSELKKHGFKVCTGSYSDIVDMAHLGASGVNLGIGYCQNHHDVEAFAEIKTTVNQLNKFHRFYEAFQFTHFQYDSITSLLDDY